MPTNLYGPGDNYHLDNSHVMPGLIYRFHNAKINKLSTVTIWGTGKPKREFLYIDDMAQASIYLMSLDKKIYNKQISPTNRHINVGGGTAITIKQLTKTIKEIIGYNREINFDSTKPDGTLRKLMNSKRMNNLGFKIEKSLRDELLLTYKDNLNKTI